MTVEIAASTAPLKGALRLPGDKSLSHRAILFSAMAEGTSHVSGVLDSADVRSTIAVVTALGASVDVHAEGVGLAGTVTGWGSRGPKSPSADLDCGNSGTTARLVLGVLAGWPGCEARLVGDESLSVRPMRRVTEPLATMGAQCADTDGHLPIDVSGAMLTPLDYTSPVASAQVKTAVLLAGLRASGRTSVTEAAASRDHTERLLPTFGVPVGRETATHRAWLDGPSVPTAATVEVPADPSSAAFMVVAALLVPGSEVQLEHVSLNPTRIGFLAVLERMGADVSIADGTDIDGEPHGTILVRYTPTLHGTTITEAEVPSLIDEIPILAVAAARAEGTTRFEHVAELRVKESDRPAAIEEALTAMGVTVRAEADTLEIDGPAELAHARVDSLGDHRLAMAWAVAGLAGNGMAIDRFDAVGVSYPGFRDDLGTLGAR